MTTPDKMAPKNPLDKIITSALPNAEKLSASILNDSAGSVKYLKKRTLSTIKITTIGYTTAISHEVLSNIFKIKPIPKNNTINNNIDTSNCGIPTTDTSPTPTVKFT